MNNISNSVSAWASKSTTNSTHSISPEHKKLNQKFQETLLNLIVNKTLENTNAYVNESIIRRKWNYKTLESQIKQLVKSNQLKRSVRTANLIHLIKKQQERFLTIKKHLSKLPYNEQCSIQNDFLSQIKSFKSPNKTALEITPATDELSAAEAKIYDLDTCLKLLLMQQNVQITKLKCKMRNLGPFSQKALADILNSSKSLKTLFFDEEPFAPTSPNDTIGNILTKPISRNAPLSTLKIHNHVFLKEALIELAEGLRTNTNLTYLELADCYDIFHEIEPNVVATADLSPILDAMEHNTSIESLVLSWGYVSELKSINALIRGLKATSSITSLDFSFTLLPEESAFKIANQLNSNSRLKTLNLLIDPYDNNGLDVSPILDAMRNNSSIETLVLSGNAISKSSSIAALNEGLKSTSSITHLDLSKCILPNNFPNIIAEGLEAYKKLSNLNLNEITITQSPERNQLNDPRNDHLSPLFSALAANKSLTILNLQDLPFAINDAALNALSGSLRFNKSLKVLNLQRSLEGMNIETYRSLMHSAIVNLSLETIGIMKLQREANPDRQRSVENILKLIQNATKANRNMKYHVKVRALMQCLESNSSVESSQFDLGALNLTTQLQNAMADIKWSEINPN